MKRKVECLVIGSGAGGAVLADELAAAGREVLVLEEGPRVSPSEHGLSSSQAMARFYRGRGMTPLFGRPPIGWVEGALVGGSTEVNSGFWVRTPAKVLEHWGKNFELQDSSEASFRPLFEEAERRLGVGPRKAGWTESTRLMARGLDALGWSYREIERTAAGCEGRNACASICPSGAKRTMSNTYLPAAEARGARILAGARVERLERQGQRVSAVRARLTHEDGKVERVLIEAEHVFLCAGATQSPTLLQRSGFHRHVGRTLRVHPMLKVVARFPEKVAGAREVLPLLQVDEFAPDVSLGGAFFTPGHLGMLLSEDWPRLGRLWRERSNLAAYYVGVRGNGRGRVRTSRFFENAALEYALSKDDLRHLSVGYARLATALLEAGALEVAPAAFGMEPVRTRKDAERWLTELLSPHRLALTTVHAFSSVPAGENRALTAVDSYGRLHGVENLVVSDASIIPDSPGVNPQATVMALSHRNARAFLSRTP